jgi:hypothetical protein
MPRHGAAWSDAKSPSKSDLRTVWAASSKDAWAGGYSSFLRWDGTAWTDASTKAGAPKNANVISGSSATDVWVAMGSDVYHLAPK